ncbi:MAG: hypothetical protein IT458_14450 [Planctomycetes bacterium]|nr:hypothetical protein [Planctomycetota bacterium]
MRFYETPVAAGLLSAALFAQTTAVVPSKAQITAEGNWYCWDLFHGNTVPGLNNSHTQGLYDMSDIPVASGSLVGISFRRSSYIRSWMTATRINAVLELSVSELAHTAPSHAFNLNHGANRVQVFRGPISLRDAPPSTWPGTWEPTILFHAPFPFVQGMGPTLVVDWLNSGSTSGRTWYADATTIEYGKWDGVIPQAECLHSAGRPVDNISMFRFQPYLGGSFLLRFTGYPSNVPSLNASVLAFGSQGPGGTFGGIPLPFEIRSLGIPAQARCRWAIDWLTEVPMKYTTSPSTGGEIWIDPFDIPSLPSLAGRVFFTQPLSIDVDPLTRQPALFPGMAVRWTIGSGQQPACSQVSIASDPGGPGASPTGTVQLGQAPTFELRFQ